MDTLSNNAYGIVLVAPSPAASGLSLTLVVGQGSRFPVANFNIVVVKANATPEQMAANYEIVRVSSRTGDILTLSARAQEGSSARTIVAGDQVRQAATKKVFDDIVAAIAAIPVGDVVGPASAVDTHLSAFSGTTGKLLSDSGYTPSALVSAAVAAASSAILPVSLTSGVTGRLPLANLASLAADRLLGRVSTGGDAQEISLGSSLAFSGSALNTIQGIRTVDSPTFAGLTVTEGIVLNLGNPAVVALSITQSTFPYTKTYLGPERAIEFSGNHQWLAGLSAYFTPDGAFYSGVWAVFSNKRLDINGTIQGVGSTAIGPIPTEPGGIAYSPDVNGPGLQIEMHSGMGAGYTNQALLAGYDLDDILSGSATPYSPGLGRKKFSLGINALYWGHDLGVDPIANATTYLQWRGYGLEGLRLSSMLETVSETASDARGAWIGQYSTAIDGPQLRLRKSRGTFAAQTALVSGDLTGDICAYGYDGTNYIRSASIRFGTAGTIGTNRIPSTIQFWTTTDAVSSVSAERMRIFPNGHISIGIDQDIGQGLLVYGFQNTGNVIQSYNSSISGALRMDMVDAWGHIFTTTAKDLRFGTNGADSSLIINNSTQVISFGGSSSSFPGLKRSSTELQCRLADDTAWAPFSASAYKVGATPGVDFSGPVTSITVTKGIITAAA